MIKLVFETSVGRVDTQFAFALGLDDVWIRVFSKLSPARGDHGGSSSRLYRIFVKNDSMPAVFVSRWILCGWGIGILHGVSVGPL